MEAILQQTAKRKHLHGDGLEDDGGEERNYDPVVAAAMEEVHAKKRAKTGVQGRGFTKAKKGLTLEEVEEQEGGVVKESKLGMAKTKRAQRRKQEAPQDETELLEVEDMIRAEEALEQDEEDGMTLEPFNLEQERQAGTFDESGNYVEHKEEEDPTMQDAWLTSDAKVVSEEVRRKVEQDNARRKQAEEAPAMTPMQAANLMRDIIAHLSPLETVNKALRRLRPATQPQQRQGKRNQKSGEGETNPAGSSADLEKKRKFDQITEAAMILMDAGELDIYSTPREELEGRAAKHPAEADDFDMFGEGPPSSMTAKTGTPSDAEPGPQRDSGAAQAQTTLTSQGDNHADAVDYSSWPVKELTRFLRERGVDSAGITEKSELVSRVAELASRGPEGEAEVFRAPEGYTWDSSTNYYFNAEAGLYYDPQSGSYFSSTDGKWYSLDSSSNQFVELGGS